MDPVAQAGDAGTFVIAQGGSLGLTAAGSTGGGTIDWDLNGDGDFIDATGAPSEVGWDRSQDLGIDVGPARTITVRNTVNGRNATGVARLVVTNTAPAVAVSTADASAPPSPVTVLVAAVVPRPAPNSADPPEGALADTGAGVARSVLLGCAPVFAGGALLAGTRLGRSTRLGRRAR